MNRYSFINHRIRARRQLELVESHILIGPRESLCGRAAFATPAPARALCKDCGNYHGTAEEL